MTILPTEYLDADTPADVVVTDRTRPLITDPTLGVPLGPGGPAALAEPVHRLVTVGDSLTHGMSSAAVFFTDRSWPALVAAGIGAAGFSYPMYGGPLDGLPVNLEALTRRVQDELGDDINIVETLRLPFLLQHLVDGNEDYWEGRAAQKPPAPAGRYDNLGIYGWDVRDALSYTAQLAAANAALPATDSFLGVRPDHDNDIAAASVLVPFGPPTSQLGAAAAQGEDGGIDTLVVALGSNNALRSVVDKNPLWSSAGYDQIGTKGAYNVWRPTHFASEYAALVEAVRTIKANRVILATVPHVTIAPIAKGVNPANRGAKWREGSRYFPFYTDPWIDEEDFRPGKDRKITHQQARAIDSAIDQYNDTICAAVTTARNEGRSWFVLDLCGILDGLAERRYVTDRAAAERNDWQPYLLPAPIADLTTRFFLSNATGRIQGGLFGLDGIHPTTSGYGIVAQAVLDILHSAGVATQPVDFAALLARDTLNSNPPALVQQLFQFASPVLKLFTP
jgi:hypothetical protein